MSLVLGTFETDLIVKKENTMQTINHSYVFFHRSTWTELILIASILFSFFGYTQGTHVVDWNWNLFEQSWNENSEHWQAMIKLDQERERPSLLHAAITGHNLEIAQHLIAIGYDLNGRLGLDSNCPIHTAVLSNVPKMVMLLLQNSALLSPKNGMRRTPLHEAVAHGNKEMVLLLVQHGANILEPTGFGETTLHLALQFPDLMSFLIEKGVPLNTQTKKFGDTALHEAARLNRLTAVECLLKHHANTKIQNKDRRTPIEVAIRNGNLDIVNELLPHHDGSLVPLYKQAQDHQCFLISEYLIKHWISYPNTHTDDLKFAISECREGLLQYLLTKHQLAFLPELSFECHKRTQFDLLLRYGVHPSSGIFKDWVWDTHLLLSEGLHPTKYGNHHRDLHDWLYQIGDAMGLQEESKQLLISRDLLSLLPLIQQPNKAIPPPAWLEKDNVWLQYVQWLQLASSLNGLQKEELLVQLQKFHLSSFEKQRIPPMNLFQITLGNIQNSIPNLDLDQTWIEVLLERISKSPWKTHCQGMLAYLMLFKTINSSSTHVPQ